MPRAGKCKAWKSNLRWTWYPKQRSNLSLIVCLIYTRNQWVPMWPDRLSHFFVLKLDRATFPIRDERGWLTKTYRQLPVEMFRHVHLTKPATIQINHNPLHAQVEVQTLCLRETVDMTTLRPSETLSITFVYTTWILDRQQKICLTQNLPFFPSSLVKNRALSTTTLTLWDHRPTLPR